MFEHRDPSAVTSRFGIDPCDLGGCPSGRSNLPGTARIASSVPAFNRFSVRKRLALFVLAPKRGRTGRPTVVDRSYGSNLVRFDKIDRPDFLLALSHTIEMRKKLTSRFVETVAIPAVRRVEYHDELLPGLRFRVYQTGRKSWSVVGRVDGKQVRYTIGTYPHI